MVDLCVDLAMVPINTPDAEFRIQGAWRILAGMIVEGVGRDSKLAPVELPQELSDQPSLLQDTAIIET